MIHWARSPHDLADQVAKALDLAEQTLSNQRELAPEIHPAVRMTSDTEIADMALLIDVIATLPPQIAPALVDRAAQLEPAVASKRARAGSRTPRSLSHGPLDVLTASRDDLFAFAREVLGPADGTSLAPPTVTVFREAESALAKAIDDDDVDLAFELLLLWPVLGLSVSATASFVYGLLSDTVEKADQRVCRIGTLAAFMLRPSPPRSMNQEPPRLPHLLELAEETLGHPPSDAAWQSRFASLPAADRESLAPLVLDVALQRAVRRLDFDATRRLVAAAAEYHVWTAAVEQAAALLERLRYLTENPQPAPADEPIRPRAFLSDD